MQARTTLLAALALAAVAHDARAQGGEGPVPAYEVGQRVRITVPARGRDPIVGVVDSLRDSALVVDTAYRERRLFLDPGPVLTDDYRRVTIPFRDIRAIEVSRGRSRGKGALRGGIIGGVAGALMFGFAGTPQFNPGWKDFKKGVGPGFLIGAPVGATLGYLWGRERWRSVPLPFVQGRSSNR